MSRTRDPLLIAAGVWFDRFVVWLTLVGVTFVLLWAMVWERGLGYSWSDSVQQLEEVRHGQAAPVVTVLCMLTAVVSVMSSSLLATWLYARWHRQAELRTAHVRGSRLEE